ncbi:MAG: dihydrolipoyl dehydrogenase family protein [Coriobacteriia bacterium]
MAGDPNVLVIGGGTAGTQCARALARGGMTVLVAEPDRLGGTCLWRGCIPKKALYQAAAAHRQVLTSETFGTLTGEVTVDWPGVLAWKWHAQETYAGDQEGILGQLGVTLLREPARFIAPGRVAVGERIISPGHIVIATGSAPLGLPVPGGPLADSSDEALRYATLPESLVIVGSGYIALEFAGIFASFGTRVTVLSRTVTFLAPFDPECVAIALAALKDLGVTLLTGANVASITGKPGTLNLTYADEREVEHALATERVLAAIGRSPALESLELGLAGIELDMRGRPVLDSALRTSNRTIFVLGDAASREQHTPVATIHGRAAAASILGQRTVEPDVRAFPFTCFTVPQLAQAGLTEAQAVENGVAHTVHRATYEYAGAAIISDVRHGLVKLITEERSDVIVGAHVAGAGASDLIYPLSLAIRSGATRADVGRTYAVHPALSELVNWAAS